MDSIGETLSFRPAEPEDIDTLWSLNLAPPVDRARILWLHFDNPFREGRPPKVDGTEARRAVALICAIYESAKNGGKRVEL